MLSPSTRAVAYLLAEVLLRLLKAILSQRSDLPAETISHLKHTIETLAHRLQHIGHTGEIQADLPHPVSPNLIAPSPLFS